MAVLDNLGVGDVLFESDSKNLMQAILDPKAWPRLQSFTRDIKGLWRTLKPLSRFCGRQANLSADLIAKSTLSYPIYYALLDCSIPSWLRPMIEQEKHYVWH